MTEGTVYKHDDEGYIVRKKDVESGSKVETDGQKVIVERGDVVLERTGGGTEVHPENFFESNFSPHEEPEQGQANFEAAQTSLSDMLDEDDVDDVLHTIVGEVGSLSELHVQMKAGLDETDEDIANGAMELALGRLLCNILYLCELYDVDAEETIEDIMEGIEKGGSE